MMKFSPQIHNRRSIRLKGYDYAQEGAYYITIVCNNRIHRFGEIKEIAINGSNMKDADMILNEFGEIAYEKWVRLPARFPKVELDVFQIMPNHFHAIILLNEQIKSTSVFHSTSIAKESTESPTIDIEHLPDALETPNPVLGNIIGAYKSLVANDCLARFKSLITSGKISPNEFMGKIWQRNFFEHIIRNEQSYRQISNYILDNPRKWQDDMLNK